MSAGSSSEPTLRVWDPLTGECLNELHGHKQGVTALVALLDNGCVLSGSADKSFIVWDSAQGKVAEAHLPHGVLSAIPAGGGRLVVLCGTFQRPHPTATQLQLWDVTKGTRVQILRPDLEAPGTPVMAMVSALSDGRLVSGSPDGCLWVWA